MQYPEVPTLYEADFVELYKGMPRDAHVASTSEKEAGQLIPGCVRRSWPVRARSAWLHARVGPGTIL